MQTNLQNKEKNREQIISIVFLCLSILIGFFFTLDQGYSYIEKKDALNSTQKEVSQQKWALETLQNMEKNISSNVELQGDIERYAGDFREDMIIDSIFAPTNGISISGISLAKWEKTPNGLSLANISLTLKAQDTTALGNFLTYLTDMKTGKKSYIIKTLNFPLDTTKNMPVSANIELAMYYFE